MLEADRLQYEIGKGPCLSSCAEDRTQEISDTATETRWPLWTQAAAATGVRSALSTPLTAGGTPTGALKVYADSAEAFSVRDLRLLVMLARPAALMLTTVQARDAAERASEMMARAVADRDRISMATGIVMERDLLGPDEALLRIMSLSRLEHRALREVAQDIIAGQPVP